VSDFYPGIVLRTAELPVLGPCSRN